MGSAYGRTGTNAPSPLVDVQIARTVQGNEGPWSVGGHIHPETMRSFAAALVVEGNDIASGTIRMLMSTQALFMQEHPVNENILFQGLMKPWIHYVPVAPDFSDLELKFQWCVSHKKECEDIAHRGSMYGHAMYYGTDLLTALTKATTHIYMSRWGKALDRVCAEQD